MVDTMAGSTRNHWDAALQVLKSHQSHYARIARNIAPPGTVGAAGFCDDLIGQLRLEEDGDRIRFLTWAAFGPGAPQLAYVLAAHHAARSADWTHAIQHARAAVARDAEDLYAQRLLLGAQAKDPDLRSDVDLWLSERFCSRPFEAVETRVDGNVNTCCKGWMPAAIGNIHEQTAEEIWNSSAAQEIRRSVLDGDFQYCSRVFCPKITTRSLPRRSEVRNPEYREIIRRHQTRLQRGPRRVLLSHDRSCNLSCPSCRTTLIVAKKREQEKLGNLVDEVLLPMLRDARSVKITGSGDPFGSNHFRQLLRRLDTREFPLLKLEIQTNGQLMDEAAWEELRLEGRVERVLVSIDAAREPTYKIVRRGGTLRRLLRNLLFLRRLRREGRIGFLQLDYVVQALNYREIPEAVDLARRLRADRIYFQLLRNWGTFAAAEFDRHNIANPAHSEYYTFLTVLRDPRLNGQDVDLGNMKPFVDEAWQVSRCPSNSKLQLAEY